MKNLKKILLLILCMGLALCFVACGDDPVACTEHKDVDGDGKCDVCTESVPADKPADDTTEDASVELIKDGKAQFQIVVSGELTDSASVKAVNNFVKAFTGAGYDVKKVNDSADNVKDVEIIVGQVSSRGATYEIDMHTLGYDGYIVKAVGTKVLILSGGSPDALVEAMDDFLEDIIEIDKEPESFTMTSKQDVDKAMTKDNYRIPAITVNGTDLAGYQIVVDATDALKNYQKDYTDAAKTLQDTLYKKAGYWLPIVDASNANEKTVYIKQVDDAGKKGFRAIVRDSAVYIECAYENLFAKAFSSFVSATLTVATSEINMKGTVYDKYDVSKVYYKDFDAKADGGKTDDFVAMLNAHNFANECGQTVVATSGKTYKIDVYTSTYYKDENGKSHPNVITIKTNVDFGTAKFTLDDSTMEMTNAFAKSGIFAVVSDYAPIEVKATDTDALGLAIKALNDNKTDGLVLASGSIPTINLNLGYKAIVILYNDNHHNYIRYGSNANSGDEQHEVILVNEDGTVDASTPLLHDFAEVTRAIIYRADDEPITISGGEFTTYANCANPTYYFAYKRGFEVSRSNTVVQNMKHYVEGEGQYGAAYSAFHIATVSNNVTFKNNLYTAHKTYDCMGSGGSTAPMGTYEISANNANNVTWDNCKQSNFFHADGVTPSKVALDDGTYYWGVMGANYVKNISYVNGCELSRFDAHAGVYNGTIKDSKVSELAIIGGGTLLIENSVIHSTGNSLVHLRDDYGSTFKGDIIIKDSTMKLHSAVSSIFLINFKYVDHDFGYTTYMPKTFTLDGFKVEGSPITTVNLVTRTYATIGMDDAKLNKMQPMEKLIIRNNTAGYTYSICSEVPDSSLNFFKDVKIIYE